MKTQHKRLALLIAGLLTVAAVMSPSVASADRTLKERADSQKKHTDSHKVKIQEDSNAVSRVLDKVNTATCKTVADKALDEEDFPNRKTRADSNKKHVDSAKGKLTALKSEAEGKLTSTKINVKSDSGKDKSVPIGTEIKDAAGNLTAKTTNEATKKTAATTNSEKYKQWQDKVREVGTHVCTNEENTCTNHCSDIANKCNDAYKKQTVYNNSNEKEAWDKAKKLLETATTRKTEADKVYNPIKEDIDYVTDAENVAIATQSVAERHASSVATKSTSATTTASGKPNPSTDAHTAHWADSDVRGHGDSATKQSKQKITVCHIPKGNPENAHTIHIAYSAWDAHQKHSGKTLTGDVISDYLGSCNSRAANKAKLAVTPTSSDDGCKATVAVTTTVDNTTIVEPPLASDTELAKFPTESVYVSCKGSSYAALKSNVDKYFDPIVVDDAALTDTTGTAQEQLDKAELVAAASQCLDFGDSSNSTNRIHKSDSDKHKGAIRDDSGKDASVRHDSGGKGFGHEPADSGRHLHKASDSGKHQYILGSTSVLISAKDAVHADGKKTDSGSRKVVKSDSGHHFNYVDFVTSDSGHHKKGIKGDGSKQRLILNCRNKDTTDIADSSKYRTKGSKTSDSVKDVKNTNFRQKLEHADSDRDYRNKSKELHVTDSSLDDKAVWTAVKACVPHATDNKKIDSGKLGSKKGDSGHKYRPLTACTSDTDGAKALAVDAAIETYKTSVASNTSTLQSVQVTKTSYSQDAGVHEAVNACLEAGGKITTDIATTPTDTPCIGSCLTPGSGPGAKGSKGRINYREVTTP